MKKKSELTKTETFSPWWRKTLFYMKLTNLLLLISVFQTFATVSYSQTATLSLKFSNAAVKSVLQEIEDKSEYYFLYSSKVIDVDRRVNVNMENANIEKILSAIFMGTTTSYKIDGRLIVLQDLQGDPGQSFQSDIINITGTVKNSQGEPVPGAAVAVRGTSKGTISDMEGKFSLNSIDADAVLVVSFVGMKSQEIGVDRQTRIDIILEENTIGLEEVVAIGYGTMDKREITSSITSVNEKDLIPGISGNVLMSMQGKVTGLSIQSDNGTSPNAGTSLQLRGVASVLAGQGPLVVIDGVPGGSLNSVSREDIKSIDILKDASAGAIYGTRAAGGVVLITTKQAEAGQARITYTGEFTTEMIRRKPEVLSAEDFVANELGQDYGHQTDWYDEVTVNNPFRQRHHINVSGGTNNARIYATILSSNQEGIALGDKRKETGGRINTNFSLLDNRVEIIAHADYRQTDSDNSQNGIFNMALKLNPTQTPYDADQVHGLNVWTGGWEYYNPVADIRLRDDQTKNKYFLADATVKLNISKAFSTQAMIAARQQEWRKVYYESVMHKNSLDNNRDGYASQEYGQNWDKTFEWLVNFNQEFGRHSLRAVAGYSFQEFNGDGFNMNNANFPVDGVKGWDMAKGTYLSEGKAGMGSWKDPRERLIAFFGRANYDYNDKYLLSVSARYEGSSKFYTTNRWGLFPAVSVGWRVTSEDFMSNLTFLNDLKVRGGYGVTGNQSFNPGVANRMYASDTWWLVDGKWIYTYGSAHNQNKNLQWEEKKEFNAGFDFAVFDSKFTGKFDIYDRKVDKMIYDISVSVPPAIHDKTTMNVGSLRNKGWEAELTWNAVYNSDFDYSTTLRMSHNKSKLESLWGSQTYWDRVGFPAPGSPGNAVRLYPGQEIGKFYVWKFAGFTEEGNWMLYDKDGNAFDVTEQTKKNEDKYFVGNAIPKLMLSWEHNLRWRRFELSAYFTSWIGHDIFNTINMYYSLPNVKEQNVLRDAFEKHKSVVGEKELSDYWIEDGDFIKLKALTLRYSLNTSTWRFIRSANVYLTGHDLFTITGYSGMDPESNINGLDPGFEWFNDIYPRTTMVTLGVQVSF